MSLSLKWRQHIEAWEASGLSQTAYCAERGINVGTFTARLSDYRKLTGPVSSAFIPVQVTPSEPVTASILLTHARGHRLELPTSVQANWVAELLRCLA